MTIAGWIDKWASACPEKTAIQFEGEKISYGTFNQKITDTAAMLDESLDIKKGDRVAFLGQNHPRTLYLLFACARIGAIFVPLNWRLTPAEHIHMLMDCTASALFVEQDYQDHCEILKEKLPECRLITWGGMDQPGWLGLRQLMASAKGQDPRPIVDPSDPILLIFTSGTTGFPKGAVLTHAALEANAENSIDMHDMVHEDVLLIILPMFHVGGLNVQTTPAFSIGATILLHKAFDVVQVIKAFNEDQPTLGIILPPHMAPLRAHAKWADIDFSCLRSLTTGSCVIPDDMIDYWQELNVPLIQVYGSSETGPTSIYQKAGNVLETKGSMGYAAQGCKVRIIDDQGNDCDIGQSGEILIKGQNVMAFYWGNKSATAAALKDGWYYTGDIGYQDDQGRYFFVDRKKDMIISGGENIYPAELEAVLASHSDILEVAVVGRADDRWGEIVAAFIILKGNSALDREDILDWLGDRLGRYKHPRIFHFVDEMPRNSMGKIMKESLREIA